MRKHVLLGVVLVLLVAILAGCGGGQQVATQPPAAPKPVIEPPEEVAKKILEYQSYQQWQQIYKYQHPDYQALVTEQEFIDLKSKASAMTLSSFDVKEAITLDSWTDKEGTGKTYSNVAEVPFSAKVNLMGSEQEYKAVMHFARDSDGLWKGFSGLPDSKKNK